MNTLQFNLPPGFHPKGTKTPFSVKKKSLSFLEKWLLEREKKREEWQKICEKAAINRKAREAAMKDAQILGRLSTGEIVGCVAFFPISLLYVAKRKIDGHYERQRRILDQLKKMSNKG